MKLDKIIWGVLLLFIGGVLLLENFNVINFYWRHVWSFWPVLLIIIGVSMLFNRNNSQLGSILALGILIVSLGVLFVKGQEKPERNWRKYLDKEVDIDFDDEDRPKKFQQFHELYVPADTNRTNLLKLNGGGTSYELNGATDSLFVADVESRIGNFGLTRTTTDTSNALTFQIQDMKNKKWNFANGGNDVALRLNRHVTWQMDLKLGAGKIDFDLEDFKVRTINFDGGAAELDLKVGALLPITDVNVKTGIADVNIKVPESSGCRIRTKTGLSSKDFNGFTKISEGLYETSNYKTSAKKVFINLDGGLSSFEVERY